MRRRFLVAMVATATVVSILAAAGGAAPRPDDSRPRGNHDHGDTMATSLELARKIARARTATAKYAFDLDAAKADGCFIITRHIPDMGFHFLNPNITEFDVTKPPILVYARRAGEWQLVAFEWVFPEKPAKDPLPGARYGSFGAACHYEDGTFVFKGSESECPADSPETGTPFVFWHPDLVTLHLWAWYPNPAGVFNGTNPLIRPYN